MKKPQAYLNLTAERLHECEIDLTTLPCSKTCSFCGLDISPFVQCWWDLYNPDKFYHFECVDLSWGLVNPQLKELAREMLCDHEHKETFR